MTHKEAVHIVLDSCNDIPQPIKILNDAYTYLLDYFDRPEKVTLEEIKFHCEDYIREHERTSFEEANRFFCKHGESKSLELFGVEFYKPSLCYSCSRECDMGILLRYKPVCKCDYYKENKE